MLSARSRALPLLAAVALVSTPILVAAPSAAAPQGGTGTAKERICHRTNAVSNPYVSIEVALSSIDGDGGNDKGQGDHFANHGGPVWTPTATKSATWGDIIPPIPGVHDGLNWTPLGQAIWSAGCRPVGLLDTDADRIPDVIDPDGDGDEVPDRTDTDDDGDGTPDSVDPDESTTTDSDGDGVPDATDSDGDGDGLPDAIECEAKPETKDQESARPGTDGVPTASADGSEAVADVSSTGEVPTDKPGNNGLGQDVDGNGTPDVLDVRARDVRATACQDDGSVVPPVDNGGDVDGDGTPDSTDRDDDGDDIPDRTDPDRDGDGNPDAIDPDDDGDRIPDVLDPDNPPVGPPDVVDTDGDGTADATDRDDDGDGVRDSRDGDADGNGEPETSDQLLAPTVALPAAIEQGEAAVLWSRLPRTGIGAPVLARISCAPAARTAPAGDVSAAELSERLCEVKQSRGRATVTVVTPEPTIVVVDLTAPAVGPYRALNDRVTFRVAR